MAVTDREEKQLAVSKNIGTSWVAIAGPASGKRWNLNFGLCNTSSAAIIVHIAVASTADWDESGEPTGAELVAYMIKNAVIPSGDRVMIPGDIIEPGQELAVVSSAATSLDLIVSGVEVTFS